MSLLYLDCFAGLAGDMMLGLLLDLGLSLEDLRAELQRLPLTGYRVEVEQVRPQGISATKVHIIVHDDAEAAAHAHAHIHDPTDHPHEHSHVHPHEAERPHAQHAGPSLSLAQIEAMIRDSDLSAGTKDRATRIFQALGEAEAHVHGVPLEHVHFHEVGAIDSIVDIVGTAVGLDRLGIDRIEASAIPTGGGTIEVAHGRMPVPAPATAQLLRGIPTYDPGIRQEMVTPTGAAILCTMVTAFGAQPPMVVDRVGYGAGTRDFSPLPNAVRGFLGQPTAAGADAVLVLETTVDDMLPEHLGYALECLLEAGALDVFFTPIQGKKTRPATLITVLAREDARSTMTRVLFRETTTFGIRVRREERVILDREFLDVDTPWGPVSVKIGRQNGAVLTVAPEFEQCKRLAQEAAQPLRGVYDLVKRLALARLEDTA